MENTQEISIQNDHVSILYRLPPEGVGTGLCEGLVSYITRLSQTHHLLPFSLIKYLLVPTLGKDYIINDMKQGGSRFFERSITLNGVGDFSQLIVNSLQKLTTLDCLNQLTLLPWKHVIIDKYLLKKSKAWCTQCFLDWKTTGKPIYEPLIWSLRSMIICPVHQQILSDICPICCNPIPVLKRNSTVGYCPHCLSWLGEHKEQKERTVDWDRWLFYSKTLYDMVEKNQEVSGKLYFTDNLQKSFLRLLETTNGNVNFLAKNLNLPSPTVWQYCNGKFTPPLNAILEICYQFNIPIVDFLTCRDFTIPNESKKAVYHIKLNTNRINLHYLKEQIKVYINNIPPISINELSRKVQHSRKTLHKHFPHLLNTIKLQYRNYRTQMKETKIENTCNQLKQTITWLISKETYPSRRAVENHMKQSGILKKPIYKNIWKAMRNK